MDETGRSKLTEDWSEQPVFERHFPAFAGILALGNLGLMVAADTGLVGLTVGILGVVIAAAFELEVLVKHGI